MKENTVNDLYTYNRLLVAQNPGATNFHRVERQLKQLCNLNAFTIEEFEFPYSKNPADGSYRFDEAEVVDALRAQVDSSTGLVIASGDYLTRMAVEAVLGTKSFIWKLRVGHGDNFGRTAFPLGHRNSPAVSYEIGRLESAKAMRLKIEGGDVERELIVPDIISIGISGLGAFDIDQPGHRAKRNSSKNPALQLFYDAITLRRSTADAQSFRVLRDGRMTTYHEAMWANVGTIAKVGNLATRLTAPEILEITRHYRIKGLQSKLSMAKLFLSKQKGKHLSDGGRPIQFTMEDLAFAEVSGDSFLLYPGDNVSICRTDEEFLFLTTRHHP